MSHNGNSPRKRVPPVVVTRVCFACYPWSSSGVKCLIIVMAVGEVECTCATQQCDGSVTELLWRLQ
eukprot:1058393-Amphidinium_carterae.1